MASQTPQESTASSPPSLKSIAQQALLDTLEPDHFIPLAETSLNRIPDDDLTSISLATFERGVAAHASAPITQTLLKYLPQLEGSMKAIKHKDSGEVGWNPWSRSTSTTFLIETKDGVAKTLVVDTVCGHFEGTTFDTRDQDEDRAEATFKYSAGPGTTTAKAKFSYKNSTTRGGSDVTLRSSNLKELFDTLADELHLPVSSTPELEAQEKSRRELQDKALRRLCSEAEALMLAPGSEQKSYKNQIDEEVRLLLDDDDRPSFVLLEPRTLDALQRDITIGRLVRALLPRDFRATWIENITQDYLATFMVPVGRANAVLEDLVRAAAVAGVDLNKAPPSLIGRRS